MRAIKAGASVLALSMLLATGACADDESDTPSGGNATAGAGGSIKEGLSVAFLPKQVNNPYFTTSDNGGKAAVEEFKGSTRRSAHPRHRRPRRCRTSTR
ncbi:hypothetical protein [Phytohabitans rumicis]|uniref:Solute-binding protein family 5 domain-containing protein n=1 Tax=Phytohabitans rumicis TaxID=1076125 RepID=A0A6V8LG19_9ACTN|nr:hypothetical protein [Phytohabitans rumicis]GFJ95264.1 hypothetical protein Prum_089060 [Phytohabitans rumicis]